MMEREEFLLNAIHRRAVQLARITDPKHGPRRVRTVVIFIAQNLMMTLLTYGGEHFFGEWNGYVYRHVLEKRGLCPFCETGVITDRDGMCNQCWDRIEKEEAQLDRDVDLATTPTKGEPS